MIERKRHSGGGFTLIELLTVVSIIAILAAIAVPNFLEAQVRSKISRARSDMAMVSAALESYRLDHGFYPQQTMPLRPDEIQHMNDRLQERWRYGETTILDDYTTRSLVTPTPAAVVGDPFMGFFEMDEELMMEFDITESASARIQDAEQQGITEEGTRDALARRGLIYTPFGGHGLYALTTPVCYISAAFMRDPFSDRGLTSPGRWNRRPDLKIDPVLSYVNFQKIDPRGWTIDGLGSNLPYMLYTVGPETWMIMFPFPPVQPLAVYDPTNGTVSRGAIFNWRE